MKLRYYLRGLGVGILVTAFLMARLTPPEKMTDAQIRQRAAELGMVEEKYLSEVEPKETLPEEKLPEEMLPEEELSTEEQLPEEELPSEELPEKELPSEGETPEGEDSEEAFTEEDTVEADSEEANQDAATETDVPAEKPEQTEPTVPEAEENYIVITVERGNGSDTVSRKLFEAGLIDSAAEYDKYLIANGYDRKLSVGNHEIPIGATEEEMAKILCGQK